MRGGRSVSLDRLGNRIPRRLRCKQLARQSDNNSPRRTAHPNLAREYPLDGVIAEPVAGSDDALIEHGKGLFALNTYRLEPESGGWAGVRGDGRQGLRPCEGVPRSFGRA